MGYAHVLDHDCGKAIDPLNRAKPLAGDLGDYVTYYLGTCYLQTGHQAEGLAALASFSATYPDSLLIRDAHVSYANALLSENRASDAAELLEKDRLPARSDIELALGRAYASLGQTAKAAEAFENVYYNMPISAEADVAYTELKRLPSAPPATPAQHKTRAELLMKAKRYNDAVDEYREVAVHAAPEARPAAELALADALHRSGRNREAKTELNTLPGATADQKHSAYSFLARLRGLRTITQRFIARWTNCGKPRRRVRGLSRRFFRWRIYTWCITNTTRRWTRFASCSSAFPPGARASYAHWKAAWLTLRFGRNEEAKKQFDEQIAMYPGGNETSAALYWRARLAEEENQPAHGPRLLPEIVGPLPKLLLRGTGAGSFAETSASGAIRRASIHCWTTFRRCEHGDKVTLSEPPSDDLHLQKAKLLGNGGLVDFAVANCRPPPRPMEETGVRPKPRNCSSIPATTIAPSK